MKRKFEVKIIVENDFETLREGLINAKQTIKGLGLSISDVKPIKSTRTIQQNKSLHKFCDMLAKELQEKHIDKREFFKEPFFLSWTTEGVKNDIWRPIQKSLTGKKSTTKLDRQGEIDLIWEHINKIIIDKYKGNVDVPLWPSEDRMIESEFDTH